MRKIISSLIFLIFIITNCKTTNEDLIPQMDFSNNKEALWDGCNSRDFFQPIVGYIADIEKTKYGGHSKYYINGILDINKDGKDDLFITEYGKLMNTNFFLFSKGDGTFFRNNNIIIGNNKRVQIRNISIKDFNKDGSLDVFGFTSGRTDEENIKGIRGGETNILLLSNKDKYEVKTPPYINKKEYGHGGDSADIDNDGDIDVFVPMPNGDDRSYFLINDGKGNFTLDKSEKRFDSDILYNFLLGDNQFDHAFFSDLNNDSYQDLILLTAYNSKENKKRSVTIVYNDKKGNFSLRNSSIIADHFSEMIKNYNKGKLTSVVNVYDFDQDGYKDLFIGQHLVLDIWGNNYILVLKNIDGKRFLDVTNKVIPEQRVNLDRFYDTGYAQYIELKDINNDGLKDIIVATDNPKKVLYDKKNISLESSHAKIWNFKWNYTPRGWLNSKHKAYPYIFMQTKNRTFLPINKNNFHNLIQYNTQYLRPGDFDGDGSIDLVGFEPNLIENKFVVKTFLNKHKERCLSDLNFSKDPHSGIWYFKYFIKEGGMNNNFLYGHDIASLNNGKVELVQMNAEHPSEHLRKKLDIKYYPDGEIVSKGFLDTSDNKKEYYTILTGNLYNGLMTGKWDDRHDFTIELIKDQKDVFEIVKNENIKARSYGIKNKKRGPLKKYNTVIKLSAIHKMNTFEYDIFLGISDNALELVLPLKKGNSWDIDLTKLSHCSNKHMRSDSLNIKINTKSNKNLYNKCILDNLSIKKQQIFLNFYYDLVTKKNEFYKKLINEQNSLKFNKQIKNAFNHITLQNLAIKYKYFKNK